MSKVFRYFFGKKDCKDGESIRQSNKEGTRGIIHVEAGGDEKLKRFGIRKYKVQRRTSDSISNDPVYLNKLFGLSNEGTVRLFNETSEVENYCPDGRHKYTKKEGNRSSPVNRQYIDNMQVYSASVTRNSSVFNPPSSSRPSEPFPYKVYDSPPRRSTLHYGVDSEGNPLHSGEYPQLSIRKGIDGYSVPISSHSDGFNQSDLQNTQDDKHERSVQQERRVTIVAPNEMGDISSMNDETNDLEIKPVRKTVLRFRPHSSASRNSRESVKLMVCRADQIEHPPMVLGRHVHQFQLKRIRQTPVLMSDDGRVLKPLDKNKQARNSLSENKEENHVRLSRADIENMCKPPRQSTEIIHPVLHSRNSMKRNSIRQSLISRPIVNRERSSILRETREEPRMSYHYSLEENKPMVFGEPLTPSRSRANSQLSRQSIMSYNQRLDNEDIYYYENERKPTNKELRYSTGSYQPDCIIMKKDKPIVVYEVHNPKNNISKNTTTKNEDTKTDDVYTKPQQNSARESNVTNPNIKPLVEIIYQEPKSQLQPIPHKKERQSFVNQIKIRKSSENYTNDFNTVHQQQPVVYAAKIPSGTLFAPKLETRKCSFKQKWSGTCSTKEKVQSKDFCGLTCEPQEKPEFLKQNTNSNVKMVSSSQQTDFENDFDFLCYPAEKLSRVKTNSPESDSKLKWRIIIKKQENK